MVRKCKRGKTNSGKCKNKPGPKKNEQKRGIAKKDTRWGRGYAQRD